MEKKKKMSENCSEALLFCSDIGPGNRSNDGKVSEMRLKAINYLLASNWSLWYTEKGAARKRELRYTSPEGKTYTTLKKACQSCISGVMVPSQAALQSSDDTSLNSRKRRKTATGVVNLQDKPEAELMDCGNLRQEHDNGRPRETGKVIETLLIEETPVNLARGQSSEKEEQQNDMIEAELVDCGNLGKKDENGRHGISGRVPKTLVKLRSNQKKKLAKCARAQRSENEELQDDKLEVEPMDFGNLEQEVDAGRHGKTGKVVADLKKLKNNQKKKKLVKCASVQRSGKRRRTKMVPRFSAFNRRCVVLADLIKNNVVSLGTNVCYGGNKGDHPLAYGWITNYGIECSCCNAVFKLTAFEVHAGSNNHRPAANIFLNDGRSLLDCQNQMLSDSNTATGEGQVGNQIKDNNLQDGNYDACVVCNDGGELICCDHCPSTYHSSCLGLENVPQGDWFCPLCCCAACGEGKFAQRTLHSVDDDDDLVLTCEQCEHKFHKGCTRKWEGELKTKWFCSDRCEHVFSSLHELIGKPFSLSRDDLTWRLLKSLDHDMDTLIDSKVSKELQRKLNAAVEVMHECFEPAKNRFTGRDLLEDIIFCRRSELKHLNYAGFYTVVLEKKGKIISVATLRVYDEVAELPFVATLFKHRRNGMGRLLMAELEKQISLLGVERLILPSAPNVLETWTTKFGFSEMTATERLNLLGYTFLDFQGTIMCQKFLNEDLFSKLVPS